jgi:hypothetical protein
VIHIKDHGPDIKDFECLANKGGIPDKPKFENSAVNSED